MIISKSDKDSTDEKKSRKTQNLDEKISQIIPALEKSVAQVIESIADITDSASQKNLEGVHKKIELVKENIKQDLIHDLKQDITQSIKGDLEGLDDVFSHVNKIFGDKIWIDEIDKTIEREMDLLQKKIKEVGQELEENAIEGEAAKSVLIALRKVGQNARKERSFDKAIEILENTGTKLLPALEIHLHDKDKKDMKFSLLEELQKAFFLKGKIDEAIQVIDTCCIQPDYYESKEYIKSQIKKSHLLAQKGEFNQAIKILKDTLEYEKGLPEHEKKVTNSAEIKRTLGIAYRGQGAYQKAIKWFKESQEEFLKAEDEMGFHNALWGIGILRYLRGEWEKAINIWERLLRFFEKQQDSPVEDKKPISVLRIKVLIDYSRTLQLCDKFQEAEEKLNQALRLVQQSDYENADWYQAYLHLLFSELFFQQNEIEKAFQEITEVRRLNDLLEADPLHELKILKTEINILLALDKTEEARTKLVDQFDKLKSNWDQVTYYRLLGLIEKHDLNFGLAKNAFKSCLEKTKEIGTSAFSDELLYIELLLEMSRTGNQKAFEEAESLLMELESKISDKKLPAFMLECNLLKAHLARIHSNYDKAYQMFSDIVREADSHRLFRQKDKALEGMNLIEHEGQQLRATKEMSVYRYLDDARRILEENS